MNSALANAFADLKRDYIEGALERLDTIEIFIEHLLGNSKGKGAVYGDLTRHIHSMKGSAGVYGFTTVSEVAHMLEDHIAASDPVRPETFSNVQKYLDEIRAILESGDNPCDDEIPTILRRLGKDEATCDETESAKQTSVLLVMAKGALRDMTAAAIVKTGFNLTTSDSAIEAMKRIVVEPPHIVISSMEFPHFTGAELAQAVQAMKSTAWLPFILVTSHDPDARALRDVPENVHRIQRDHDTNRALLAHLHKISGASTA